MRLLTLFIIFFSLCNLAIAQNSFQVKGLFYGITSPKKVIISYRDGFVSYKDTMAIKDGVFTIVGKVKAPCKVTIYLMDLNAIGRNGYHDYTEFYVEPGEISIKGYNSMKTAVITGGPIQKEYLELQDSLTPINVIFENISSLNSSKLFDDNLKVQLRSASRANYEKMVGVETRFIASHPSSIVSWDIVSNRATIIEPETFEPVFNSLSAEIRRKPEAVGIQKRLELAKRLSIGNTAIEFTSTDINGVPVSLSKFKGKYVLVDFWASWCGPCRGENPYMLDAYTKLKDSNFEILGVSLDDSKEKWIKAITEDKLPWTQVSDLEGFNTIAVTYGIRAIPQNYLLNPEGIIIAKDLRGENLVELVQKAMNK